MKFVKRLVVSATVAVLLAVAIEAIIVPTCYTLECIACSYVLDATLCALSTGG